MDPKDVSEIACDVVAACPNLRYVSWMEGHVVEISKSPSGEFLALIVVKFPSFLENV